MPAEVKEDPCQTLFRLCFDCNKPKSLYKWCKDCNFKRSQKYFNEWSSINDISIYSLIREAQLKAKNKYEYFEWIPYNRLRNIQFLTSGGFSKIYRAIWLDGNVLSWNISKWSRKVLELNEKDYKDAKENDVKYPLNEDEKAGKYVVLKINEDNNNLLNECKNYLRFIYSADDYDDYVMVQFYGITQDPESKNYMIVMDHIKNGSLKSNLKLKKFNPNDKYKNLHSITKSLVALHKRNLVHGDLHSGNLLVNQVHSSILLCDFGSTRPENEPVSSNAIYGIIPYIAPEVLRGKPYSKAADIYSFGMIMWEFTSGIPAFSNISHNLLPVGICQGLRPDIIGTDNEYVELMKRCWHPDPNERPTAEELMKCFQEWKKKHPFYFFKRNPVVKEDEDNKDNKVIKVNEIGTMDNCRIASSVLERKDETEVDTVKGNCAFLAPSKI